MFYTDKVYTHFNAPHNVGTLPSPSAQALVGAPHLGAVIRLTLQIENDTITQARFKAFGGGAVIASMSWLTEQLKNKTLSEARLIKAQDIVEHFELEPLKTTFAIMSVETLEKALKGYTSQPSVSVKIK